MCPGSVPGTGKTKRRLRPWLQVLAALSVKNATTIVDTDTGVTFGTTSERGVISKG